MRCVACDAELTDRESTNKFLNSGTYADMCIRCLIPISDAAPSELVASSDIDDDVPDLEGANPNEADA